MAITDLYSMTTMLINSDFSQPSIVAPEQYRWVASPQEGVERVMLDRLGGENGRATSIVRYARASDFPLHLHPGGEEIFVLSGVFTEGAESYPAGWYIRNPPGSSHQPSSNEGAIIFVKLWQMPGCDGSSVRINTNDPSIWLSFKNGETCPLYEDSFEKVSIERINDGQPLFTMPVDGAEILILTGQLCLGAQQYRRGSWIRLPSGEYPEYIAGKNGVTLYLKTGHLATLSNGVGVC
jgi:anti-sigma factor ChrR (cupin superfamily)